MGPYGANIEASYSVNFTSRQYQKINKRWVNARDQASYLQYVAEDWYGRVDGVGDDEEARLRTALGALLSDALHDRCVRVEQIVSADNKRITHPRHSHAHTTHLR